MMALPMIERPVRASALAGMVRASALAGMVRASALAGMVRGCALAGLAIAVSAFPAVACEGPPAEPAATPAARCDPLPSTLENAGELLDLDLSYSHADAIIAATHWIAPTWQTVPFMFTNSDVTYSVRTRTFHLATYADRALGRRIEGQPRMPRAKPAVDVWTTLDFNANDEAAAEFSRGQFGADYKLDKNVVVGLSAEHRADLAEPHLGAYVKAGTTRGLLLESQAGWGPDTNVPGATAIAGQDVTYAATKLKNAWTFANYTFAPSVGIGTFFSDTPSDAGPAVHATSVVVLEQRLSRSIDLERRTRIEPFLSYKHTFDVYDAGTAGTAAPSAQQTFAAGLNLEAASQFSLSVTTELQEKQDAKDPALNGRLQLKVPLQ